MIDLHGIEIDPDRIPRHIAIIMDGNGRWATKQGFPRPMGHYEGYKALREIVKVCGDLGVTALTVYAFSSENWTRSKEEVDALMNLFAQASREELPLMMENNVQMRVIGRFHELPESAQQSLGESIAETSMNTGLVFNLAINYGGRNELLDAVKETCRRAQSGELDIDNITDQDFSDTLYTRGLPDPDILIRTAGELRVSNFLLWQIAYAEIWVTSTLWPDFTPADLMQAISDFQKRVRKFGAAPKPENE
ncbi:MAG: isoprenyl transferase [Armatimonadota bacterium]